MEFMDSEKCYYCRRQGTPKINQRSLDGDIFEFRVYCTVCGVSGPWETTVQVAFTKFEGIMRRAQTKED